jgi:hypothetical protein
MGTPWSSPAATQTRLRRQSNCSPRPAQPWGLPGQCTDPEHSNAVITHAMTRHGRRDASVNNADEHVGEPFVRGDNDDAFREALEINVVAQ